MTKTKNQKPKTKNSSPVKLFNPSSAKVKMSIFALTFVVIGAGVLVYNSFAATIPVPPSSMFVTYSKVPVHGSDGQGNGISCRKTKISTPYGASMRCYNYNNDLVNYRWGNYNIQTNTFYPSGDWLKRDSTLDPKFGSYEKVICKNMGYYFGGVGVVDTAFGPASNGQIYQRVMEQGRYVWYTKDASLNLLNGNCYPTGGWYLSTAY